MKYSIIIPCFNEEENIEKLVSKIKMFDKKYDFEFILVNNGSNDDTEKKILESTVSFPRIKLLSLDVNFGYGNGILRGLELAEGDYLGWTHADGQTNVLDFIEAFEIINKNTNVEIFIKGYRTERSLSDSFFTFFMSIFESMLFKTYLSNINSQPTLFQKKFYDSWKNAPLDFSLDLFAYVNAKKYKLKIVRFKTKFLKREYGKSSWNDGIKSRIKFISRTISYSFKLRREIK